MLLTRRRTLDVHTFQEKHHYNHDVPWEYEHNLVSGEMITRKVEKESLIAPRLHFEGIRK
jgi:hypothetical protein